MSENPPWVVPQEHRSTLEEYQRAYVFDTGREPAPDLNLHAYGLSRMLELQTARAPGLWDYQISVSGEISRGDAATMGHTMAKAIQVRERWRRVCGGLAD